MLGVNSAAQRTVFSLLNICEAMCSPSPRPWQLSVVSQFEILSRPFGFGSARHAITKPINPRPPAAALLGAVPFPERQNLTMRMSMRRFTRLTNAFSKKFEPLPRAGALFVFYNFCRVHKTLAVTPAMASGLTETVMKMTDVVALIDAANPVPAVPRPYKKLTNVTAT